MVEVAESSSALPKDDKPVIVRVKRKAFQSPLEAFWLEINERPLKRPLLDFEKLSISNSSAKVEELKTKKVLVQHVETVKNSEATVDVLQSFVVSKPSSTNAVERKVKSEERRRTFKADNKQDQLLVKAKEKQKALSENARFEQIWRSRKGKRGEVPSDALGDMCHLYDIVRVDEETATEVRKQENTDLEDETIMSSFLPLLREFIPSAAEEIESEINNHLYKQASKDDYVYDLYAVKDDDNSLMEEDASNLFPLVQVDDDDNYYDGPDQSEFESDDSNAEDNPLNDYPDEEASGDDEELESKSSDDNKSEELGSEDTSEESEESADLGKGIRSRDAGPLYEDDMYDIDDDNEMHEYDDNDDDDDDNGRWAYH